MTVAAQVISQFVDMSMLRAASFLLPESSAPTFRRMLNAKFAKAATVKLGTIHEPTWGIAPCEPMLR
jgi:hypothetical protein